MDNICAQCGGYGGSSDLREDRDEWHPCYHCRTTGKCSCEECHPTIKEDSRLDGRAVYVTTPIYNNMDGIVGYRTQLDAIFTSPYAADAYATRLDLDSDEYTNYQVVQCKFELST